MSKALDFFWSNDLVEMPTAVEFSTWMAVGPCFHTISERVVRIGTDVWALTKMVPYLASAADAVILRMIFHTTSKMPLVVGKKSLWIVGVRWTFAEKMDSTGTTSGLSDWTVGGVVMYG